MKKSAQLIAVVVALAVIYPAAAWYTGKRVEAKLKGPQAQTTSSPYVKVIKDDYQRGVFSSVQDTTIEIDLASFPMGKKPALPGADAPVPGTPEVPVPDAPVAAVPEAPPKPIQLHFINRIQHGPLPGFRGFGAAAIKTELVFDDAAKAELAKVFGTASPLQISSNLSYGGGGHVAISSPAFTTTLEKDREKIAWQGLTMDVDFEKDYKAFRVNGSAPGLAMESLDGKSIKIGAITLKSDVTQAYPGTSLYLGKTDASLLSIVYSDKTDAKKDFSLDQFTLGSDVSSKDDLIGLIVRIGVAKISVDQQSFSDLHYDYGVRRIHGPSLAKMLVAYSNTPGELEKLAAVKTVWDEVAPALLQKEPELVLERISVVTSDGEAKLSGTAKLVGATATDLSNPMLMLTKVQANADVVLTDTLIAKVGGASQKDPEAQKAALDAMNMQIAALTEQGFIERKGKLLSSKIEWKDGKLTINGKPFSH
ncbi:YdgA family protein [Undibacterium sp. TJN19]|uniref:YdgA family protein n=1 Tax=Undibacterium sp. TJN19 TaxID=3413055 RepID=UPI003BF3EC6D